MGLQDALTAVVTSHIPGATLLSRAGDETSYRLPADTVPSFSSLLRTLEGTESVRSFGLAITTLEEVFMCLYNLVQLRF